MRSLPPEVAEGSAPVKIGLQFGTKAGPIAIEVHSASGPSHSFMSALTPEQTEAATAALVKAATRIIQAWGIEDERTVEERGRESLAD
jgi:hypothetical protein